MSKLLKKVQKAIHPRGFLEEFNSPAGEIRRIYQAKKDFYVPVRLPLVLVSQIQRSGGTLMSQLFDGHPQVHAHPQELMIGYPKKENWPELDLAAGPDAWFRILFEKKTLGLFRHGFFKGKHNSFPFLLPPHLQRELFFHDLANETAPTRRRILDAYFSSYFNAWLDYAGWEPGKRCLTGFTPKVASHPESVTRFFTDYPDGHLISIVREPASWFVSYRVSKTKHFKTNANMLQQWTTSVQAMIDNHTAHPGRVLILSFEDLVGQTDAVMRRVAAFCGLDYDPILAQPTYQHHTTKANSHFAVEGAGMLAGVGDRREELDPATRDEVDAATATLFAQVRPLITRP